MRKNSVRKFIHAILDLLPLFVIPIFAIYSMNHEISGNSVNTSGYEVRNKFETNEVNGVEDLVEGNIYYVGNITVDPQDAYEFTLQIIKCDYITTQMHNVDDEFFSDINNCEITISAFGYLDIYLGEESYVTLEFGRWQATGLYFIVTSELEDFRGFVEDFNPNITASDYNVLEYVYNEGIVLDDEDIMSQFVYVTYNAVDKYFNMGNVFNMTGVYDWFVVNIFGGNAPISLFIVWNVVLYEFVMDLLMLLYGLFMWFIDMIEKLMNKPLDSIK